MKCIKKYGFRIYISHLAIVSMVSAGWWGILYPEFGFSEDTFSVAQQRQEAEQSKNMQTANRNEEELTGAEVFFSMLEAQPGQIKIKSKLLEEVFGIRGNDDEQQCTDWNF